MKKLLMTATVPSMIGQFNMENIQVLQDMGINVHVACDFSDRSVWTCERVNRFIKELNKIKVTYHQIDFSRNPLSIFKDFKAYKQLKSLVKKEKIDVIHCHTPVAGVISRIVSHRCHIGVIYTAHGFHFYDGAPKKNWFIYYPIEKFLSKWTDTLITINKEDYKRACNDFSAKDTRYVPGVGVDVNRFSMNNIDVQKIRENLGVKDSEIFLLSVGELSVRKNHEVVIRALAKISRKDFKYFIVGQGILKDKLTDLINEMGLKENINLLGFRTDVLELCHAADCFVFPSHQEGLPVALMEAMASGLPVICSNIRGNVDLIENQQGGYLVEPDDIDEFAKAINTIFSGVNSSMGLINQETMKNYDKKTVNEIMKQIYRRFL